MSTINSPKQEYEILFSKKFKNSKKSFLEFLNTPTRQRNKCEKEFIDKVINPLFFRYLKHIGLFEIWKQSNSYSINKYDFSSLSESAPLDYFNSTVSWSACLQKFGVDWQKYNELWHNMLVKTFADKISDKTSFIHTLF